jgi:predicted kinase
MDDEHNQLHGNQKMDADELEMEAQAATLEKTRKHRKEIEKDAQLLANRIALLTQEEMKTWKKIEDTRKRTTEITNLKIRNQEREI